MYKQCRNAKCFHFNLFQVYGDVHYPWAALECWRVEFGHVSTMRSPALFTGIVKMRTGLISTFFEGMIPHINTKIDQSDSGFIFDVRCKACKD